MITPNDQGYVLNMLLTICRSLFFVFGSLNFYSLKHVVNPVLLLTGMSLRA